MFKFQEFKQKCRVTLSGEITIYNVVELKQDIDNVIDDPRDLEINLNKVCEIDSAGVQVLMMVKKHCLSRGKSVKLVDHSESVVDAFETLGLIGYFGDQVLLSERKGA